MRYVVNTENTPLGFNFIVFDTQRNYPAAEPFYSRTNADKLADALNRRGFNMKSQQMLQAEQEAIELAALAKAGA